MKYTEAKELYALASMDAESFFCLTNLCRKQ